MTVELEDRLRAFGERLERECGLELRPGSASGRDEMVTAADLTIDVVEPLRPAGEGGAAGHRRRRLASLGIAAAVALGVVGVVVVDQADTDLSTDPSSPGIGALSSLEWTRIPHDEGVFGAGVPFGTGVNDVTVGGPGLVAVGQGDDGATVWTSPDGFTWSRIPHDETIFGTAGAIHGVAGGGPGLVAVGGVDDGAAVWTSPDGLTWSRVPHDETIFGTADQTEMQSVTAGGPGFVAVGSEGSEERVDAAVWTSVDGFTWSRVPHDETIFGGDGLQRMSSVTTGGPGLVAVGSEERYMVHDQGTDYDDITGVAAVWTSVDGITWSRVPHDERLFGGDGSQWMNAATSANSRLVAVGGDWSRAAHHAAVWTSMDGINWSRVPNRDATFGGPDHDQLMAGVTATGSGIVAVGRAWGQADGDHSSGTDDSAASVWTSTDGTTWSWYGYDEAVFGSEDNTARLLTDGPVFTEYRQFMNAATATASGIVTVGGDWSGPSYGGAVWVGEPSG